MGYGRMGIYVSDGFRRAGVVDYGAIHGAPPLEGWYAADAAPTAIAPVALWCSTPPHVKGCFEGQFAALWTMTEYTEIPAPFRENLACLDHVFVPSEQNVEVFSKFNPNVSYLPISVGPQWKHETRPEVEAEFRFLCAGHGPRKNNKMIVRAFREVFGNLLRNPGQFPRPRLIMRSADYSDGGLGVTNIRGMLSDEDELELYKSAHCFVSASRGEGWGLMPHQAIAQGCPTILPNAHGHAAFADLGIPIDTHMIKCGDMTGWGDAGEWWEPEFDQLCQAMWEVYNNYEKHVERSIGCAEEISQRFNWDGIIAQLIEEMPALEGPVIDIADRPKWKAYPRRAWKLQVLRKDVYVINGQRTVYLPGETYWESADMRERLKAANNLTPESMDATDPGLVIEELVGE